MSQAIFFKLIFLFIVAILVAFILQKFLFFVTIASSYSMYPQIKPKDRIFTVRVRNVNHIKRGDVLVFYSNELKRLLIKRVIGLPYDFVVIQQDGTVYINEEKLNESYIEYQGKFNGEFQVPEKSYLFLGDNRTYSKDSRTWVHPYISENDIKGKAIFCIFPFRLID